MECFSVQLGRVIREGNGKGWYYSTEIDSEEALNQLFSSEIYSKKLQIDFSVEITIKKGLKSTF